MKYILLLSLFLSNLLYSQGDCPAVTLCSGGNFNCVVDATDELNASNNGCLATNEGVTSFWIQICTLTAGTIQFTINPSGSVDYDWALWQGNACPPLAMPIRCSYAIPGGPLGDQTGVNSTNNAPQTDISEGALGNNWTQDILASSFQCYIININRYGTGSNSFNISFGGTAILDCFPLPTELLDFKLDNQEGKVFINWQTASEINNSHFIIQKDILNPTNIGRVEGNGNSNSIINYQSIDNNPELGINYYRLIQYDYNGDSTIYDWKSIYIEQTDICCKEYYDLSGKQVDINNVVSGMYIGITNNDKIIKIVK